MTKVLKWVAGGMLIACVVLAASGGALYLWMRTSLPVPFAERAVPGLAKPVEVLRDQYGIPHILAESDRDAAFALGYVHAQDRLWQMESMRRLGAGRLSEVMGDFGLATDRYMRTLGLYRRAEAQIDVLSPEVLEMLKAYADGVNAWLTSRPGALPPEFVLLFHEPAPWRIADSLVWGKLMGWQLATNRIEEMVRGRLAQRLSQERIKELYPDTFEDGPVTGVHDGEAGATHAADSRHINMLAHLVRQEGALGARPGASNFWVVDGSRTVTGHPILANDPHLTLTNPGTWYLARLITPERTQAGATAPGLPFVVLGHANDHAWGFTTTGSDQEDLIIERLVAIDAERYETPSGTAPLDVREEIIDVRFGPPVAFMVRESRHGPIVTDLLPPEITPQSEGETAEVVALSAAYLRADDTSPDALYGMARARSWPEFLDALRLFRTSQQNVVYANRDGTIAFVSAGAVPIRIVSDDAEPIPGRQPAPGWNGDGTWSGYIPFEDLPQAVSPAGGYLINANNRVEPTGYEYDLGAIYDPGYRAQRIKDLVEAVDRHDLDSLHSIQYDTTSLAAQAILSTLLETLPETDRHREIIDALRGWSGEMDRHRPEPLIYAAWMEAVFLALVGDELQEDASLVDSDRPWFFLHVFGDGGHWCDNVNTPAVEICPALVVQALELAIAKLGDRFGEDWTHWRWGDAHQAVFSPRPFGQIPGLSAWASRRAESDGGRHTVNRAAWYAIGEEPFRNVHSAGYRAVYDLADLSRSRFVIVPGQSANPLSTHYDDMIALWQDGGWVEMGKDPAMLRKQASGRLLLRPADPVSEPSSDGDAGQ